MSDSLSSTSGGSSSNGTVQTTNQNTQSTVGDNTGVAGTPTTLPTTPPGSTSVTPAQVASGIQVTPGTPVGNSQINIADYAGQLATDPSLNFNSSDTLSSNLPKVSAADTAAGTIDPNNPASNALKDASATNATTSTGTVTNATAPDAKNAVQAAVTDTTPALLAQQMTGAQGNASNALISSANTPQIDTAAVAAGDTPTGAALQNYASQNISNIIDTSTPQGQALAQQLGDGNYTDSKATLQGQLAILQKEFTDPVTGQPTIPSWAAGTAANVSRIASFTGMTGTAATAALAQALMQSSLPIAQADSQFFQTVTLQNLSNKQQSIINTANVLSNMDMANLSAREQAAVTNSQAFLQMDMANLSNEQQAAVINQQGYIQGVLADANAANTTSLQTAQNQDAMDQFYSGLSAQISQYNAGQANAMSQYNAGQENAQADFNSTLENNRQQYYADNQFKIDSANAAWRQNITMTENSQAFQAAATDVQNRVNLSNEQLTQLWDRANSLLDYVWKTADNTAQRQNNIAVVQAQGTNTANAAAAQGYGSIIGTVLGAGASALFTSLFG